MLLDWVAYLLVGRLLIFLWMEFPLPEFLKKIKVVRYLHGCDLCSGVWIFSILAYFMQMDLLQVAWFPATIFGNLITGCIVSFLMHIFLIGWHSKFDVVVI